MFEILTFSLGQMQANCYFLIDDFSCLIIDPGDSPDFILEELQRKKLTPIGIIATHGHFDHIMAVGELQLSFNIPLFIFREDMFLVDRLESTAKHFLGFEPSVVKPKTFNYLTPGDINIRELKFHVIQTPGHTPGSCCLYFKEENILFSGDTLFHNGIGRYDFSYSDKDKLSQSLKKLFTLPKKTIVYPGHGKSTTLQVKPSILSLL